MQVARQEPALRTDRQCPIHQAYETLIRASRAVVPKPWAGAKAVDNTAILKQVARGRFRIFLDFQSMQNNGPKQIEIATKAMILRTFGVQVA